MFIAKEIQTTREVEVENKNFELFVEEAAKTSTDKEVMVLKSVGHYNLAELLRQKENLQDGIIELDKKIKAIKDLK